MTELYLHQRNLLQRNPDKELLCWDVGTGKTMGSIEWAKLKPHNKILVICPKALRLNWEREINKYYGSLDRWEILSKEEFRKDFKTIFRADIIIVDEAHYFAGTKSQMTKSLLSYVRTYDVKYILLLTATPLLASPWSIFILAKHLGHQWSYLNFRDRFFQDRYIGRRIIPEVKPGIEEEIAKLIKSIGDVVDINECVDIPEQTFEVEYIELTEKQKTGKKMILETNPIVRFVKEHQLEQGSVKSDGYVENTFFPSYKNDRILELIKQNNKIAVVCRYNLQIDHIKEEIIKAKINKSIFVIRGDVKDRDEVVQQAEAADKCIVLINAACCEGYELPSINLCVFASLSFSYLHRKQIIGRFLRLNKLSKNVYIDLIVPGGADEAIYKAIVNKKSFYVAIYTKETK